MRSRAVAGLCAALLAGCAGSNSQTAAPAAHSAPAAPAPAATTARQMAPGDEKIASAGSVVITRRELTEPLIEAYGLEFLIHLLTLERAAEAAADQNITITPADIEAETNFTIAGMAKDASPEDYDRLLQSFLNQQQISRVEFDIVMKTNAYLRKLAEPQVEKLITEEVLKQAFGTMYGENVRIRHIQLANMTEVVEAQRRLAAGEDFADVARAMSRNAVTAPRGGEMTPFSLQMGGLPDSFKQTAFALKEGEVSEAVMAADAYHLIKLEERIPPKAVEFEDHREAVRERVHESFMMSSMRQMRNALRQDILQRIDIEHPVLARQFKEQTQPKPATEEEKQRILRDLERQREAAEETRTPADPRAPRLEPQADQPADPAAAQPSQRATTQPAVPTVQPAHPPAPATRAAPAAATRPASATDANK